jgi:hypothetical protein
MKRKRNLTIYDIGSLRTVPVVDQPRPSLKRFQREEEARIAAEQEQLQAVERARVETARLAELSSPATRSVSFFWSQPIQEIQTNISADVYDNGISLVPVDTFGEYETGPRNKTGEDAAWNEFNANLTSQGCTIYRGGFQRLRMYLESLAATRGVSLTSVANWATALARLHSLSVFEPHELEGYPPTTKAPAPAPKHPANPLEEIETLNLDSRDGNAKAKQIATNDFFGRQMAPIADRWRDWLLATFNYVLTDDARKAAGQWWLKNPTANPLTPSSWTQLRLNLVKRGVMPASCKTPEEILNETIEASSERSDSYEARRNLKQQIRELAQK